MRDVVVKLYIDVLDVLQRGRIEGALFGFDNSGAEGSLHLGTDHLATAIAPGESVVWAVNSLECEAYVNIEELELPDWMEAQHVRVNDHDYWRAHVVGTPSDAPYAMTFAIGRYGKRIRYADRLRFIARPSELAVPDAPPVGHDAPVRRYRAKGAAR